MRLHSQRRSLGDWLQTSVLGHWLDLAAPKCGCEEPEDRKRVNKQTVMLHIRDAKLSAATLIYGCPPTTPHSCFRYVGTVVPQPVPWTVLRNWSSVQKLISLFFFSFSHSQAAGDHCLHEAGSAATQAVTQNHSLQREAQSKPMGASSLPIGWCILCNFYVN